MVALPRRVFERGDDVAFLKQRIIGEDFRAIGAGGQQVQHVLHADAQPAQAGTAAALAGIDGDWGEAILKRSTMVFSGE